MTKFNFLLFSDSFKQNSHAKETIYKNIEQLVLLKEQLGCFNEKLFKDDNIYNIKIIDCKKIYEVLYDKTLDADYKYMLSNIIDKSKDITEDIEISMLIGLNYLDDEDCIYSIDDWFEYHYSELSNVFTSESEFYHGIVKYFPTLEFQGNIINTLKTLDGGCVNFTKDIISSLKCLDENLCQDILDANNNLTEALKRITARLSLDVTLEGSSARKKDLSFKFLTEDKKEMDIYCEAHVKLARSSNSSDNTWYPNRIYFHQGRDDIKNGKILIGHIGKHL